MCGNYGERKFFEMFVFPSSVARGSAEEIGDIHGRELTCIAIDRRMGGKLCCLCIYTCLYR